MIRGPQKTTVQPVAMASYRDNKKQIRDEAAKALRAASGQLYALEMPDLQIDQSPGAPVPRIMTGRKSDIHDQAKKARKIFAEAGICMTPKKIGKNTWNSAINKKAAEAAENARKN